MENSKKTQNTKKKNDKRVSNLLELKQVKLEEFDKANVDPRTFIRDSFNNYQDSLSVL